MNPEEIQKSAGDLIAKNTGDMQKGAEELVSKLMDLGLPFVFNMIAAVLIFLIGKWAARKISNMVEKVMTKANVDAALVKFTGNLVFSGILIFTIIAAIGRVGVQTASFIAVLGAAGLAIGMAMQGTLSNFSAGVMLIIFKPFRLGDFVDAGGVMGSVQEIQIFNTILSSPDNRKIIIPNSQIMGGTITNFSHIERRRVDMVFGISYDDDIKKAKEVLQGLLEKDSRILKEPVPVIAVSELGDSSVNIVCRPWVKPADYWGVWFDMMENAKIELEAAGLSIPYPQRDVHMYQESATGSAETAGQSRN